MDRIDPALRRLICDDSEPAGGLAGEGTDDALDPIAAMNHETLYGIPAPGSKAAPRSISEIGKALERVRQGIAGREPYASRLQKLGFPLAQMAEASAQFSGSTPVTEFLRAAATGSDRDMRAAIRKMLAAEDIVN